MTFYWLYGRLDVHVGASEDDVRSALDTYADAHVKGGRAVLKPEHYAGILREHGDARDLYATVMG